MMNQLFRRSSASIVHRTAPDAPTSAVPKDPPEVVITIKTTISGKVEFVFQDYKIFFRTECPDLRPSAATVNGIPWPDLEKPFEMGFTPDFSFAEIYEKSGRGAIELTVKRDRFILSVDDSEGGSAPYQISISMKRQPDLPEKNASANGKKDAESNSAKPLAKQTGRGKPAKRKKKR